MFEFKWNSNLKLRINSQKRTEEDKNWLYSIDFHVWVCVLTHFPLFALLKCVQGRSEINCIRGDHTQTYSKNPCIHTCFNVHCSYNTSKEESVKSRSIHLHSARVVFIRNYLHTAQGYQIVLAYRPKRDSREQHWMGNDSCIIFMIVNNSVHHTVDKQRYIDCCAWLLADWR